MQARIIKVTGNSKTLQFTSFEETIEKCEKILHKFLIENSIYKEMLIETEVFTEIQIEEFKEIIINHYGDNGNIEYVLYTPKIGDVISN